MTSYDVGKADAQLPDIPICRDLDVVRTLDAVALPFGDGEFDAVLSSGVLEHVAEGRAQGDEVGSMYEIFRVLKPGGFFVIYQLPQRCAWQEAIIRWLRLGYSHPRRFSAGEIARMLSENGYTVRRIRRGNMIPKNLTGMPAWLKKWYRHLKPALAVSDTLLCRVPTLNQFAGTLEVIVERNPDVRGIRAPHPQK